MKEIYHSLSAALYITIICFWQTKQTLKRCSVTEYGHEQRQPFQRHCADGVSLPSGCSTSHYCCDSKAKTLELQYITDWCSASSSNITLKSIPFIFIPQERKDRQEMRMYCSLQVSQKQPAGRISLKMRLWGCHSKHRLFKGCRSTFVPPVTNDSQYYSNEDKEHVLEVPIEPVLVLCGNK